MSGSFRQLLLQRVRRPLTPDSGLGAIHLPAEGGWSALVAVARFP